ncbi:MAG: class I SAM-dependent methyltransferase [Solirubrobacteraceae bacterium]
MSDPRRWELSAQELHRIAEARASFGTVAALRLVAANPRLAREFVRVAATALRAGVLGSNSLISLLGAERARTVVPDAATGVDWFDAGPFIDALSPWLGGARDALELGCGAGRISRQVAPAVRELVCTDVSPMMIAEARDNLRSFANVRAQTTDGFTLSEFGDGAYDVVFGQGVLGYLPPNQLLGLLGEVARVLRPGGVSVFNFSCVDDPQQAREHLATVIRAARARRLHGAIDEAYTRRYLEDLHELAGLPAQPGEPARAGERVVIIGRRGGQP